MESTSAQNAEQGKYTVVARRYRPKTFSELVGQSTVAQALLNAIQTNRVGHAYLFTGARGVGKTSTARIFAKALNASAAKDGDFDPNSDVAQAIDSGEDMDVIEIDGASNRGIDEIRQLRANAAVRPSRSPYKIYIIDEVHMLTTQAFNALLKTLEEPPGHVKFIFCTTDPEKMPITVLSRCQRFDFPPVQTDQILGRLKFICENEGTEADEAALQLIARRAAGSMRDSQSLLEQLLSFGGNRIRVDDVHAMLGTADEARLAAFATRLIERDAAGALVELDGAASEGVDIGQLAEQLLGYLRDMMVMTVGCSSDLVKTANPNSIDQLKQWGSSWGVSSLMAAIQILDETIVKMRHSVQSRVLVEIALVQICQLQDLQALSDMVRAFAAGQPIPPPRISVSATTSAQPSVPNVAAKIDAASSAPAVSSATNDTVAGAKPADSKKKDDPQAAEQLRPGPHAAVRQMDGQDSRKDSVDSPNPSKEASSSLTLDINKQNGAPNLSGCGASVSGPSPSGTAPVAQLEKASVPIPPSRLGNQVPSALASADTPADLVSILRQAAGKLGGLIVECANMVTRVQVAERGKWKVFVAKDGAFAIDYFNTGDNSRKLSVAILEIANVEAQLEYSLTDEQSPNVVSQPKAPAVQEQRPNVPQSQMIRGAMNHPLVKHFVEMFDGQVVRVDPPQTAKIEVATEASDTTA